MAADPGPLCASWIYVDSAPAYDAIVEGLRREVVDVDVAGLERLESPPDPERSVCILWAPAGAPASLFRQIARWAATADEPIAVIGCAMMGGVEDSVVALSAGVDDFVAGRCSARELAGRVRALRRRVRQPVAQAGRRLRYGPLTLDAYGHELFVGGRRIRLTATELAVLRALMTSSGRALSRAELLDLAWGDANLEIGERAVDNVVLRLRRKVGEAGLIETVRGVGFRLAAG